MITEFFSLFDSFTLEGKMNSFNYLLIFIISIMISTYTLIEKEWGKTIFDDKNHSFLILFSLLITTIFSYFIYPYIMPILGGLFVASLFAVLRKFTTLEELREHPELNDLNHDSIFPDPEIQIDPSFHEDVSAEFDKKYFVDHEH